MSDPSMLIQPKGKSLLKPSKRPVNFLGAVSEHKKKFIKAMEKFNLMVRNAKYESKLISEGITSNFINN